MTEKLCLLSTSLASNKNTRRPPPKFLSSPFFFGDPRLGERYLGSRAQDSSIAAGTWIGAYVSHLVALLITKHSSPSAKSSILPSVLWGIQDFLRENLECEHTMPSAYEIACAVGAWLGSLSSTFLAYMLTRLYDWMIARYWNSTKASSPDSFTPSSSFSSPHTIIATNANASSSSIIYAEQEALERALEDEQFRLNHHQKASRCKKHVENHEESEIQGHHSSETRASFVNNWIVCCNLLTLIFLDMLLMWR